MTEQPSARIVQSEDGSHTLYSERSAQHYHSIHGALSESLHIFIETAYRHRLLWAEPQDELCIFELGFGSGLNALLTLGEQLCKPYGSIKYYSVEAYPLEEEIYSQLQFNSGIEGEYEWLMKLHRAAWDRDVEICPGFVLHKIAADFSKMAIPQGIDICYFDAFSPEAQPELWSAEAFEALAQAMNRKAVLSTYSAKGEVRRRMQAAGLRVERLPGPLGKRHILRASKEI